MQHNSGIWERGWWDGGMVSEAKGERRGKKAPWNLELNLRSQNPRMYSYCMSQLELLSEYCS